MNIPNFLTIMRILLIPLLIIFILDDNMRGALIVFMIAAVSDAADGLIARYFNQRTEFGAHVDPIADKLLLCTSYVTLAILHQVPAWLTVLVVSRDIIILSGIGLLLFTEKKVHISPSLDSKVTTLLQLLSVLYVLSEKVFPLESIPETYLFSMTALATLFSGLHYVIIGFRILGEPRRIVAKGLCQNDEQRTKTLDPSSQRLEKHRDSQQDIRTASSHCRHSAPARNPGQ